MLLLMHLATGIGTRVTRATQTWMPRGRRWSKAGDGRSKLQQHASLDRTGQSHYESRRNYVPTLSIKEYAAERLRPHLCVSTLSRSQQSRRKLDTGKFTCQTHRSHTNRVTLGLLTRRPVFRRHGTPRFASLRLAGAKHASQISQHCTGRLSIWLAHAFAAS